MDIIKFNSEDKICDVAVALSILKRSSALCNPKLSFVSNWFSPCRFQYYMYTYIYLGGVLMS